jgi:hypothetical protein
MKKYALEAMLESLLIREGKPDSRALPRHQYGNPINFIKFGRRNQGEDMDRMSDIEQADSLIMAWYRWTKAWRPNLGAGVAPWAKNYRQDEKHNDAAEESENERLHKIEMQAVDYCLSILTTQQQQAVGIEMRNREVNHKVWRAPTNQTYTQALQAVLPHLKKRNLLG